MPYLCILVETDGIEVPLRFTSYDCFAILHGFMCPFCSACGVPQKMDCGSLPSDKFYEKRKRDKTNALSLYSGGDGRDRTVDLLTASQTLSQLSYAPVQIRY